MEDKNNNNNNANANAKKTPNLNKNINNNIINNNIISFMLLNEKGKILLSRQYSPICKSKVLYHASFFYQYYKNLLVDKKEINNNSLENIDKDIKYLYISLNKNQNEEKEIILILIININFNIFQANEIIKLLTRIIFVVIKVM
jgi:hypothetical protein